jgi:hypothetical protein
MVSISLAVLLLPLIGISPRQNLDAGDIKRTPSPDGRPTIRSSAESASLLPGEPQFRSPSPPSVSCIASVALLIYSPVLVFRHGTPLHGRHTRQAQGRRQALLHGGRSCPTSSVHRELLLWAHFIARHSPPLVCQQVRCLRFNFVRPRRNLLFW